MAIYPKSVIYRSGHIISYLHNDSPCYVFTETDRKKKRRYKMDFSYYLKILNSILHLNQIKKNKLIFLTLTFPIKVIHADANKIFCNFIDNFQKTYNLNGYVGVAEYQYKNQKHEKNIHYHLLSDYPFVGISEINSLWLVCINSYYSARRTEYKAQTAKNAVRLPPKRKEKWTIIEQDILQLSKYMAKYLSKGLGTYYDTKFFFASQNCRNTKGTEIDINSFADTIFAVKTFQKKYEYNSLIQIPINEATDIIRYIEKN